MIIWAVLKIFSLLFALIGRYTKSKVNVMTLLLILNFLLIGYVGVHVLVTGNAFSFSMFDTRILHAGMLEAIYLIIFAVAGLGISFYSQYYFTEYLAHKKNLKFYFGLMLVFIYSMTAVLLADNALYFLVAREIMSLSSYFLVIHEYQKSGVVREGNFYFIIAHVGMFFILMSFVPFILSTGSFAFAAWDVSLLSEGMKQLAFFCALIGFGAKAGMFPFHIRLPKAHPIAPSNISAMMSGFMVKLPVLMLLKFIITFFALQVSLNRGIIVLVLGGITAVMGIFYSVVQNDIKKALAYSTMENIWLIFVGLALFIIGLATGATLLAVSGLVLALYHSANHAMFKSMLFLAAGSIIERTTSKLLSDLGGLIKKLPVLGAVFLIGAIAIAGLPPLNGFNAELLAFGSLMELMKTWSILLKFFSVFVLLLVALMSILALISFGRLFMITFLGTQRKPLFKVETKASTTESLAYIIFIVGILALAVMPGVFFTLAYTLLWMQGAYAHDMFTWQVMWYTFQPGVLLGVLVALVIIFFGLYKLISRNLVKKTPIRACGYPYEELPARAQYSAFALIHPLRKIYKDIYMEMSVKWNARVEGEEYTFKKWHKELSYDSWSSYFVDNIYEKLISVAQATSIFVKRVQNGVLQYYISYIFVALVALVIWLYFSI